MIHLTLSSISLGRLSLPEQIRANNGASISDFYREFNQKVILETEDFLGNLYLNMRQSVPENTPFSDQARMLKIMLLQYKKAAEYCFDDNCGVFPRISDTNQFNIGVDKNDLFLGRLEFIVGEDRRKVYLLKLSIDPKYRPVASSYTFSELKISSPKEFIP
jgi:hypothetical protein